MAKRGIMRCHLVSCLGLCGLLLLQAAPALAKRGRSKSRAKPKTEANQAEPSKAKLNAAIELIKKESYAEATVQLDAILNGNSGLQDDARYHMGKALYRMKMYHSALSYFGKLLEQGPKSRFYKSALEWCLFIGRKIVADELVNELIAKYAGSEFPKEYRDEFYFKLARFHFNRARTIEAGALAAQLGETKVEEKATGGLSISGDIFGEEPVEEKKEEEDLVKKKEGGGLSIGADLFGDEPEKPKKPEKKVEKPAPKPKDGEFVLTSKEHITSAERFVIKVDEKSRWGARAKFLEALILYQQGKANEALEAFKKVILLTQEKKGDAEADQIRELTFFQLARTHFGAQQPSFSIFYYAKVDRDSYAWLDSLYEASWAEFRLGNYEKALGNLLTLHAPFFTDEYFPESLILKAVIYYENCRYPEAKQILTGFLKRYEPVLEELNKLTARQQAADKYYEILENLRGKELAGSGSKKAETMSQILSLALSDGELKRLDQAYQEVKVELESLSSKGGFGQSGLADKLAQTLGETRLQLAKAAGTAVRRKLEQERNAIKDLIEQAIRIDIETSKAEAERIESKLRGVQSLPPERRPQFVEWADDEKLVWPFKEEYWRDELGTYELTLANTCQATTGN